MNNFEKECFAFAEDILINRPKCGDDEEVLYCSEDRDKIIEVLEAQKNSIKNNETKMTSECYTLLGEIYDGLLKLVREKIV